MTGKRRLRLFEAFGVELEYMIVDASSLNVRAIADEVLRDDAGEVSGELEFDDIAWSNELTAHVIELKTNGPAPALAALHQRFQDHVGQINSRLNKRGARLMPTAMHPWMDPFRETTLWPHDCGAIYQAYDQIFDCRGHGWANLQSVHLNLPFAGDDEFGRLHAAVRLLLPLLPALAASSPLVERRRTGLADNRMEFCRNNSRRVPSVAADTIPEPVYTQADYVRQILQPMYRDIAPLDPDNYLQDEFLNARGAIARFGRGSIEIRVLDVQECPEADLAICQAIVAILRLLISQRWTDVAAQQAQPMEPLVTLLGETIHHAEEAVVQDAGLLRQFGLSGAVSAGELWRHLLEEASATATPSGQQAGLVEPPVGQLPALRLILEQGCLSRRILRAIGDRPESLPDVYRRLCDCLAEGSLFSAPRT